ncbi:MAG: PTS system mannose/fructose/sorbose family transporter subunit IID [Planctomycetaceae bacterium]|nr:PTS system mannose/fructose/sorbose family transporter subunit IID [Planctomycetaceae bacterium]
MTTANNDVKVKSDRRRFLQFLWRSWTIQASWNYERQMNMGFLYGIAPTLDEIYHDDSDPVVRKHKQEAYDRHMAFYNCTPQTSAFVLGLAASMEKQYAEDRDSFNPDSINAVKTSLMGPLSGVGDSFFQGTVRVIAFGLGISLAQQGNILGPILAMVLSFIPSYVITYYAGKLGFNMGSKYLHELQKGNLMDKVMYVCGIVGLMVVGAMVASMVTIGTPLQFAGTGMQGVIDNILPRLIPLGVTLFMYYLIKRRVPTGWLLTVCIVGGIILNALGIFA